MKKLFATTIIALFAVIAVSCENKSDSTTELTDSTAVQVDSCKADSTCKDTTCKSHAKAEEVK